MSLDPKNPFFYYFPDHGVWALFTATYGSQLPEGVIRYEITPAPIRKENLTNSSRTVEWYDTQPVARAVYVVKHAYLSGYKRRSDVPATLPEFVDQVDARLEDLYSPVYEPAEYRYEAAQLPTVTLDRAPGALTGGWESQLPYCYLVDPICAASAPCVLPANVVWKRVTEAVRALVSTSTSVSITGDYMSLGCLSLSRSTQDGHRIVALSVVTPEYTRSSYSDSRNPSNIVCEAIHAETMEAGERAFTDLMARVRAAVSLPTRTCPRCSGCGEIAFNEPDVKPAPSPEPPRKSRRR